MSSPEPQGSAVLPSEKSSVVLNKEEDPLTETLFGRGWLYSGSRCVRVSDTGEPLGPKNQPSIIEANCATLATTGSTEYVMPACQTWSDGNASEKRSQWNLRKIFSKLNTPAQCIQFAEERRLIPKEKMCSHHKKLMSLDRRKGPLGAFLCYKRNCRHKSVSRSKGTWFENAKVPLNVVFEIMYMYSHDFSYLDVKRETAREDVATVLSSSTIADWFLCCRETIIVYHLDHQDAERKIGGPGKIVHIEQSKFGELKYRKERNIDGQLVLGMMMEGSDDLRLELCPDNEESAKMLLPMIIQKHVEEGTEIHTNFWEAFDFLSQYGYFHKKVNQKTLNGSKDPNGTHMQDTISQWRQLKALFKRERYKGNFTEWLVEYSWRRNIRMSNKDAFEELLKAVEYNKMENWSDVVLSYPETPEPKDYAKTIRSAEIILSEDLAPFETEWLVQTLLFKPVGLFEMIPSKRASEEWLKTIADSFKILSKIVEKCWDIVENYYNDIIELCMLSFDPQTRKEAIFCLLCVVKHPSVDISEQFVSRHINALEEAKICKSPLAQLVGKLILGGTDIECSLKEAYRQIDPICVCASTICRYHPERVQEHFGRIWRIYLNMLQPNNKTDQVVNSVLQGINGLFEHFGDDIEIAQLNGFYDMMTRECIKISKCLEVLLSIFKHHARLFKERLAKDRIVRLYLWQIDTKTAMDALSNIYEVVLSEVQNKEDIINSEVLPRIDSGSILIKHTALRILIQARTSLTMDVPTLCSGIDLEFQLRAKKLSYEEANTVSWCIGSSVSNSETMLLTAIMFYDNLPTSKKRDIVVNGVLKASDDVRKAALVLLLKLCLQDNLDKYIDIWRVLLDNTTGPDLGKAVVIFEDALHHILEVLASFIGDSDKVYAEVKPILYLMAVLLSLHKTEFYTESWCQSFKPTVIHLAKFFGVDSVKMINETPENEIIYVEKFEEDTVLSKLLSTLTATPDVLYNDTLSAFQIIFSSKDTDLKVLSKALSRLEVLIESKINNLDKRQLSMIINQIMKLKSKYITDSKDARIFQKDVTIFLGKYGHMTDEESFSEDTYVLKLKNKVNLNIPNIVEGTTFKIDLQRVLQLCLLRGETEALYSLLVILSASLCDRSDPGLQEAIIRVIHALFRTNIGRNEAEISVYPALLMCNTTACVQAIMKGITEELSPDVRRKLSDSLEVLLSHEPGSETTGELLRIVGEQATFIISRDESLTDILGLDIIRAFLAAITDNNALIIDHLPNILTFTSKHSLELFEISSNILIGKIDLFTDIQIKEIIKKIIEKYATNIENNESNSNKVLGFTKRVLEIKKYEAIIVVDLTLEMCQKLTIISPQFLNLVTLLAHLNSMFDLNSEIRKEIVNFENCLVLEQLIEIKLNEGDVDINAALVFLKEYAQELVDMNAEKTLQCLGNLIENIPPTAVLLQKNNLTTCVSVYKEHSNYLPTIKRSYEKWCKKLDLQNITEYIEETILFSEYSENFTDIIHALKIMSELVGITTVGAKNWTALSLKNLSQNELKWGRIFLSDLLSVSEKSLTVYEFDEILEKNSEFVKNYINVYFGRLISKPFVLKAEKSTLIVDIVEYFAKTYKEENFQNVLDLVENLWPTFQELSSFDDKLSVLLNLLRLPKSVGLDCPAVKWAITLLTTEGTSLEDRIKLIATLPAGEEYSAYYRTFASCLPVRLSEMQGRYIPPFRALLDTLATNGDMTLLDIVITLAGGDDTKGWWDHAIDACMTALAAKEDVNVLNKAYRRTKIGFTLGVCNRVFLPLLRHSSRKFCEKYIATIVTDLFSILRVGFKEIANNEIYRKRVVSYAIAFNILKVAFEKITTESLENGVINESAGSQKPWYFLEQTCKYCITISANVKCPSDATDELKNTCLWLQCSSYNCLTTAICRRKLNKNLSARIFNANAWATIVDKDAVYPFDLQAYARYRGSKPTKRSVDTIATSSSFTGTVRSRLFLTTLSENPLQFDMIPEDEDEDEEEDDSSIEFEDSVLNAYGCLSTLTSLLEHASTLEHTEWRSTIIAAITSDLTVNAKWLLAQAICNAEEALKPHASALCPALLQLIADTSTTDNGKPVLNNLHIDVISTITKWNITDLSQNSYLNTTIEYLINTSIVFQHQRHILKRLLNTLNGLLQLYGNIITVTWRVFQDYCIVFPKDLFPLLPIFERLLKNGVALPELLTSIFANSDAKQWTSGTKLAEVCGLALSLADSETRKGFLSKFWHILNTVRSTSVNSYVKILFYAQKSCKECCDFNQLKIITDLAPKVEKSKCLTIISTYLENATEFNDFYTDMYQIISLGELFDSDQRVEAMKIARNSLKFMEDGVKSDILKGVEQNSRNSSVQVRKEAFGVFLTAFQGLVKRENHNPFKRKAVDSSLILDTMESQNPYEKFVVKKIFDGVFDHDELVSNMMSEGLEECLSKDITMRFAELFYIIVNQCSLTTNNNLELSNYGSKLLELLFSDLRSQDTFKVIQLRDDGLPQIVLRAYESMSVRTRTNLRTVLRSGVTYRQRVNKAPPRREIDVQMSITDILDVFLQLTKTNSQVCQELCVQMMKCLQGTGRRFDLDSVIAKQLFDIIKRKPFCLTPLVLDACRIFVKDISSIQGFNESVKSLKQAVSNSQGYLYTNILYEDLQLRSGDRNLYIFSMMIEDSDAVMRDEEFSLQGLIDVFGSLANWDDLRIQDKRQIEGSLPPLWVENHKFTISLREYFQAANKKLDYGLWFNKMVASYYPNEVIQNRISWLKQIENWPKRHFVTSAVIEAIQWDQSDAKIFGDICSSDCLAEWAARLMIRSSYYNQHVDSDSQGRSSLSKDELLWCKEANERKLPSLALQGIDRNKECLLDVDILPWVQEKVKACRTMGLNENNLNSLQKALEVAEKQTIQFASQSSFETNISIQKLILQLHHDLESISKSKLDEVMQVVSAHIIREKGRMISSNNAQVLKSMYETAMIYYDELWTDNDESTQNDIILQMTEIIDKVLDHNLTKDCNLLISVLLNRLAYFETTISDVTAKSLLNQMNRVFHRLDFFSIAILKKVIAVLPINVLNENYLDKLQDAELDVCKEYFQLICDANYSLLQYCSDLRRNILDETEWNVTFNRMKCRLFETKYGGTDYQSLNTLKNKLYALENITAIDPKANELKLIIEELRSKAQRTTLRLSQLCPDLCSAAILDRKKVHLQRLLRLPPNVYVVKFAEQISVFTDSIRRPCVVKALLSNGLTRRFICKSGEPMFRDASVQRAAAILPVINHKLKVRSYNVTPLSYDSAIIEYLEDHIRIRDLMEEKHDINNIAVPKAGYEKLILAPSLAMEQYNAMCDKVTPYVLRSSIENNCSCVEEFIVKKRTFEDTLSSMTILNWLFGVGDRHLQNIMYSVRDGGVCGVDWASIFQYGCQELPPARLTANILAVCDVKVLESRLQSMLLCLRESQKLFEAFIRTSFYWSEPEFKELKHVKNILQGKAVCYEITRECMDESEKKYKNDYVRLLDQVFENFVPKELYSIEEQVSCLLQHCTEPRILSVTPPGWEAWL